MPPRGYSSTADGRRRAWVRVTSKADEFDELRTKRFPKDTPPKTIRDWRAKTRTALEQRLELRRQERVALLGGGAGFRSDVLRAYLPAVTALPTYKQRVKDMQLWIDVFGDRPRRCVCPDPKRCACPCIKTHEIRAVRDRWLMLGPKRVWRKVNGVGQWLEVAAPLAASTVNHRLRALSNFYTVLDPHTPNPVHDVPEVHEPQPVPRAIDYETIRKILDAMPDRGRPVKGEKRSAVSVSKVLVRVMAWTGTEPTELEERVSDEDIAQAVQTGVLFVPGRHKGDGSSGRLIPLNDDAVAALTALLALRKDGHVRARGALKQWKRACMKVVGRPLRLKDLRHSYVTKIVGSTKDLKLAQLLAGHTDDRTTQRYALAALLPMLRAGVDSAFPPTDDKETK